MATLKNRIELEDGMSPVLNRIRNSLGKVALGCINTALAGNKSFSNLQSTTQGSLSKMVTGFTHMSDLASSALNRIGNRADSLAEKLNNVSKSLQKTSVVANTLSSITGGLKNVLGSTIGKFTIAGLAANGIAFVASKLAEMPSKLMGVAQGYGQIEARLNLLTGSQAKTAEMNDLIYQSALRSRGSFESMADSIAKIGMTAKEAFPDPKEIVPFMEGIQKLFVIGGTSKENQGFAMLQLTQALGSGKLQGDEFRSIAENASLIEKMVSKTLGVTQGELKQLASDGVVTAEVVKRAILENMDEINAQFEQMPMTFEQHMQRLETVAYNAFTPVMKIINDLWKSKEVAAVVDIIADAIDWLGNEAEYALNGIVNNVKWLAGQVQEKWEIIKPILVAAGVAVMGIGLKTLVAGALSAAGWAVAEAAMLYHAVASAVGTAATFALTLAQAGLTAAVAEFNAVMAANPIAWFIGLVFVLVGAFYLAIAAVNRFAGTSISATGIIVASFVWLFTVIANGIKWVINRFIDFANFLGSVFQDPTAAIYNLFADIWNGIVELVAGAVNEIIDKISHIPGLEDKVSHVDASGFSIARKEISGYTPISHYEYGNPEYNAGKWYGKTADFNIFDWFKSKMPNLSTTSDTNNNTSDTDTSNTDGDDGGLADSAGRTADNTGRMADAMDMLEDEVKELREFANQEMINYYTKREYSVSVGDINNSINRPADIDGVIDQVTMYIMEGMSSGAEKVHA